MIFSFAKINSIQQKFIISLFLESTPTNDYNGIANYRLALSYELTDDRKNAEKYFSVSGSGNMDLEDDQLAKRKR
ncbi:MAG: hypothetical protein MZV64_58490 [Ignavibacteriales bacterium]|nr:hypothetical protein [Ignavibacteriales bacterium]